MTPSPASYTHFYAEVDLVCGTIPALAQLPITCSTGKTFRSCQLETKMLLALVHDANGQLACYLATLGS